jgi:UDP-glucose:tetrahydrobiopterin glucosyltransferase
MRIALIAPLVSPIAEPQVGGSQAVVADLARALVQRGHDVVLYAPERSRVDGVNILSLGIDSESLQDDMYRFDASREPSHGMADAYRTIFHNVRSGDFDVIHSHGFDAPAITEGARVGLSILHTLHLPPTAIVVKAIQAARSQGSTVWCAGVSHAHAKVWSTSVHIDHVLRNGVPVGSIPYCGETSRDAVIAARFSVEKGIMEAIEAARTAGWSVNVFGTPYDEQYEIRVRRHWAGDADVRFLEPVSRPMLWSAVGTAGVVLCLSHWDEPFGMVAAEAQAAGTPVIASARGGLPEIIQDGRTGFLVADGDVPGAARALDAVHSIERAACRRHALAQLDLEHAVSRHEHVYRWCAQTRVAAVSTR